MKFFLQLFQPPEFLKRYQYYNAIFNSTLKRLIHNLTEERAYASFHSTIGRAFDCCRRMRVRISPPPGILLDTGRPVLTYSNISVRVRCRRAVMPSCRAVMRDRN